MTDQKITTTTAARLAGVAASTWRSWQARGRPHPEPAPPPDGWFELRIPWWREETITSWVDRRRARTGSPADMEENTDDNL